MYLPAGNPLEGINFKDAPRLTTALLGAALAGTVFLCYKLEQSNQDMTREQARLEALPAIPQALAAQYREEKCNPHLLVQKWESAVHEGTEYGVLCEPVNNNRDKNGNLTFKP